MKKAKKIFEPTAGSWGSFFTAVKQLQPKIKVIVRITRLGRTAWYCYSAITVGTNLVGTSCILFFKWEEMVVEGAKKSYPEFCSVTERISALFRPPAFGRCRPELLASRRSRPRLRPDPAGLGRTCGPAGRRRTRWPRRRWSDREGLPKCPCARTPWSHIWWSLK